ncbi:MAG TPA: hypothetical protein VMF58_16795 [Rhizomicrobium sp.]|nr:hypothetical protein [Rhizomicrobium sp.]
MSESDITNQLLALSGLALSGLSVFFTLFSGYVVALWFFLHQAPLALRLVVFLFLTLAFLYLAAYSRDMALHAQGLHLALQQLAARQPVSAGGQALLAHDLNSNLRWANIGGLAAIYIALLYLTFFYRWRR